jgi:lipoate synthase
MKLLKTIEKIIKEAEELYNNALESVVDEKELERLEKNYQDSLKLMKTFSQIKKTKSD